MLLIFALSFSAIISNPIHSSAHKNSVTLADLLKKSQDLHLDRDPGWLRLGHYTSSLFSGDFHSKADGSEFFLSENGVNSPQAELQATIEKFFSSSSDRALCQFPARRRYLSERLQYPFRKVRCPLYEKFKSDVAADSVSLVFSSYYLNNPSSAFGHTMLRFNKKNSSELLDYAVNYAAEVDTPNAVLYAFKGLSGMFKGKFAIIPYYLMVRKYNSFESRDLWSYELDLTSQEVEQVVDHIWEMGSTYFDYYYLSENCSYLLLAVLEAAAPRLHLLDRLPFYVIPADTVKAISSNSGLVRKVLYRPSERIRFFSRYSDLSEKEKKGVQTYLDHKATLDLKKNSYSEDEQMHIWDTLIDYYDYKFQKEIHIESRPEFSEKKEILLARSKINLISSDQTTLQGDQASRPDISHGSARFRTGYSYDQRLKSAVSLGFRFALHDLLDRPTGYPEYAAIDFASVDALFYPRQRRFELDNASLVEIHSLMPIHPLDFKFSWHAALRSESVHDRTCQRCTVGMGELGGGFAFALFDRPKTIFFQLLEGQWAGHPDLGRFGMRLGFGPQAGFRFLFSSRWIALLQGRYQYFPTFSRPHSYQAQSSLRYFFTDSFSFDASFEKDSLGWTSSSKIGFYF